MAIQTVRIPVEVEIQVLQDEVKQMKKMLEGIKPDTKAFIQLSKAIEKIDHNLISLENRASQTFSSQSKISSFANSFNKVALAIQDVYSEYKRLDFKNLKLPDNDPGVLQIENFKTKIAEVEKKIAKIDTEIFSSVIDGDTLKLLKEIDSAFNIETTSLEEALKILQKGLKNVDKQIKDAEGNLVSLEKSIKSAEDAFSTEKTRQDALTKKRQEIGTDRVRVKNARQNEEGNLQSMRDLASKYLNPKELAKIDEGLLKTLNNDKRAQVITAFYANLAATITAEEQKTIKAIGESAAKVDAAIDKLQQAEDNYSAERERKANLEASTLNYTIAQNDLEFGQQSAASAAENYKLEIVDLTRQLQELINTLRNANSIMQGATIGSENTSRAIENNGVACEQAKEKVQGLIAAQERLNDIKGAIKQWFGFNEVINLTKQAVRGAITHIRELDDVMTQIAVVTDMTQAELWDQIETYSAMAQQYGVTTKGVYEVSQLWYQQGR